MPGTFYFYKTNKLKDDKALSRIELPDKHYINEFYCNENIYFGNIKYKTYPVRKFENKKYIISFEGHIYNKQNEKDLLIELIEIADIIFDKNSDAALKLKKWLKNSDGDFLLSVLRKSDRKIFFLNDVLGRLPVYYFKGENEFFLTRDFSQIPNVISGISIDKMALAQSLLFGYPLGKRTLFNDVFYLDDASLLIFDVNECELKFQKIHEINLEEKKNSGISTIEATDKLYDYFLKASKDRINVSKKNILSLSGGLDSRAVLSAFKNLKIPVKCATYLDEDHLVEKDLKIAKQLAKISGSKLEIIELKRSKGKDVNEQLKNKMGMNYLGMSFILPFFKKINQNNLTYFTGDGGDKVLPDLRPCKNIIGIEGLLKYIIKRNKIFSLREVEKILGLNKNKILEEIKDVLNSYPENDMNQKYVHFLLAERTRKWLFEGEDRNRYYFWSVSPFYSFRFFEYAMNCPDKMKKNYNLFRFFLNKLSPDITTVNNANWDISINSEKLKTFLIKNSLREFIPSNLKQILKNKLKKKNYILDYDNAAVKCFNKQFESNDYLKTVFNVEEIRKIKYLSEDDFYYIFTLSSVCEKLEYGKSSIEGFKEKSFV